MLYFLLSTLVLTLYIDVVLSLSIQVMRFEDVYKVHLRSLEILPSIRLLNAFKLLTLKCFEDIQKVYLNFF